MVSVRNAVGESSMLNRGQFLARDVIYTSRAPICYDVSVRLSVTEVHWVAMHAGNAAAAPTSEVKPSYDPKQTWPPPMLRLLRGWVISRYASHC